MFVRPDAKKLATLIDQHAEWKNRGPGSALELIEEMQNESDDLASISVQEVRFFAKGDLPVLRERFPDARNWNADRVPNRLNDGLGCLICLAKSKGTTATRC